MSKKLNFLINIFLIPLLLISVLGTASLLLSNMEQAGKSGILLTDTIIVTVILFIIFRGQLKSLKFHVDKRIIYRIMIVVILIWQGYILLTVAGFSIWDPGFILLTAANQSPRTGISYFSSYPNTFLLLIIEHGIWKGLGQPRSQVLTVILGIFSYGLLDVSLLTLYSIGKKYFNQRVGRVALGLGIVLLGLMPWAVIPYSDIPGFALTVFSLTALLAFFTSKSVKGWYYSAALSGFFFGLDYLIKPSLVITYIAFAIVAVVSVNLRKFNKQVLGAVGLMVLIPVVIFAAFSSYQQNNSYIRVDRQRAFPMMHFATMGATGNGGYNLADVKRDETIKSPEKRKAVDTKVWKQRITRMGWNGYQKFLIKKQVANTADGAFSWGGEAATGFLIPFKHIPIPKSFGRRLFFAGGPANYNSAVKIIVQFIWLGTLIAMIFTVSDTSFGCLFAKCAVVGFFLFLLLFEGGRSRYVIQFLPFILLLAGSGMEKLKNYCTIVKAGNYNDPNE